jgi:TonB family protein
MANVETDHNNTPLPQQEEVDASASINLCEENLEALLSALSSAGTAPLTAPGPISQPAPPSVAPPVAATPIPSAPPAVVAPAAVAPTVVAPILIAPTVTAPVQPQAIVVETPVQAPVAVAPSTVAPVAVAPAPVETPVAASAPRAIVVEPVVAATVVRVVDTPSKVEPPAVRVESVSADVQPVEVQAAAPVVAPVQQDMNSKLALLSSIKQRRAITTRPEVSEASTRPAETATPVPAASVETERPVSTPRVVERSIEQPKLSLPARSASTVAPQEMRSQDKATLLVKKEGTNYPPAERATERPTERMSAPAEVESRTAVNRVEPREEVKNRAVSREEKQIRETKARREESPKTTERQKRDAAVSPVAAKAPEEAPSAPSVPLSEFSQFGAVTGEFPADKPNFFATKAGMGVIGGAVLSAAVAVFLFSGHSGKTSTAQKNGTAGTAQSPTATVVPAVADAKSPSTGAPTNGANQHPNPLVAGQAQAKPGTPQTLTPQQQQLAAQQLAAQQLAAQQLAAQQLAAQQLAAQQLAAQQKQAADAPKTTARTFSAPTTGARPASVAVVDAPPAITPTVAAPVAVGMPARINPLPPPTAAPAPAAAQPAPAGSNQPTQITVAGKTQAARLVRQVVPVYPAVAKTARVQGTVRFRVTIGADGQVKSLTSLGGPLPLVQSATDAVRQWRYQPTVVDGKAVEVVTEVDVQFAL